MNPLIESSLDRLDKAIGKMALVIESAHARIDEQAEEKEKATVENWGKDRKMSILEENVIQMNKVLEENRRLREKHVEATEHAAKLLAHVRELQGKFTP